MSGKFNPIALKHLLQIILKEYSANKSIFGIPEELFFDPQKNKTFNTKLFGQKLDTPIGVAAGPHTQMAQNIIGAWLMGARYIELKTVQTLEEPEIPKPCIDMQDEGYNCEWSQELKIKESFNEYLNAWIVIHILNHKFAWGKDNGMIFNMSLGYNMQGIMNENVQWFLNKMFDSEDELKLKLRELFPVYPDIKKIDISPCISNNITLSTMHGCPANEIEEIAGYLIDKKKLNTFVKLNPTLLGPADLRDILNSKLNFRTIVPDLAFEHDLKYPDALKIIRSLQKKAMERNLQFGLKLTNTLESANNKNVFDRDIEMMYLSGRALHPVSINVAARLQQEFKGELLLSFSAGTDAFNIPEIIAGGFATVTVCTDLLKPGGYMRFNQYFEELDKSFEAHMSKNINEFILNSSGEKELKEAALQNLVSYAVKVLDLGKYRREYLKTPDIKTKQELGYFDCIAAPCRDACATNQDVPDYLYHTSARQFNKAFEVILKTNPFPSITGMICDHLCQSKCTRINYDDPLQIREVKRFISLQKEVKLKLSTRNGIKVAIIGAGPSGLSCAYYLALAGFSVDVFEARSKAGGMVQFAIPGFRLTDQAISEDFRRVTDLGVIINYDIRVDREKFQSLKKDFRYIFIGAGAQLSTELKIDGINSLGVIDPLDFLFDVKLGKRPELGNNVVIIGGGNTAMDAARTAFRLTGENGKVTILYRRTINEMPADQGEIKAVLEEGVEIIELAIPEKIIPENKKVKSLLCTKMRLEGIDSKGRPSPVKIEGSEFEILCDTVIPSIGQDIDLDFVESDKLFTDIKTFQTKLDNVLIGGDAKRGASTAINAIADGRKAAEQIMALAGIDFKLRKPGSDRNLTKKELMIRRSHRKFSRGVKELALADRKNFRLLSETPQEAATIEESGRCLYCDEICNICTTVCPNFANYSYEVAPVSFELQKAVSLDDGTIEIQADKVFTVNQKYQILNIANFCNACGNCSTFCPTDSAPYKEKPKFFLTISSFNEAEEGYYLAMLKDRKNLIFRKHKIIETLTEFPGEYIYETDNVVARFNKDDFKILEVKIKTPCVRQVRFEHAAEMSILIKGAENLVFA